MRNGQLISAALAVTAEEVIDNARWLVEHGRSKGIGADVRAGNDQLGKIIAIFSESHMGKVQMPTINVHYPEGFKPDADKPNLTVHQEGA